MKHLIFLACCTWITGSVLAQERFWQVNPGIDRRPAVLQQIHTRGATIIADYVGPQPGPEKTIRIQGIFDGNDSVQMAFGFVSPIHKSQEDLLYSGTAFLRRESPEGYAKAFYDYYQKLQAKYGPPGWNRLFNAGDPVTEAVFLKGVTSGTEFRLYWRDTTAGIGRELIYKPDRPEKLIIDYRAVDIMRLTRYLKDATDY